MIYETRPFSDHRSERSKIAPQWGGGSNSAHRQTTQPRIERKISPGKPHAFALTSGQDGASCYFGSLIWSVTRARVQAYDPTTLGAYIAIVQREEIMNPVVSPAVNLNTIDHWSYQATPLGFFGAVYLKWECDEEGTVDPTTVEVVGPTAPTSNPIPSYISTADEPPAAGTYTYFVQIGEVTADGVVTQMISSDFYWNIHLMRGEDDGV